MAQAGLMGAAGAAQGLETLLARRLLQAKFEEEQRQAQARESLGERTLGENTQYRLAQQAATEQERQRDEQYRRDALGQADALRRQQFTETQQNQAERLAQEQRFETGRIEDRQEGRQQGFDLRRDLADQADRRMIDMRQLQDAGQQRQAKQAEYLFYVKQEQDALDRELRSASGDAYTPPDPARAQSAQLNFQRKTAELARKYKGTPGAPQAASPVAAGRPVDPLGIR